MPEPDGPTIAASWPGWTVSDRCCSVQPSPAPAASALGLERRAARRRRRGAALAGEPRAAERRRAELARLRVAEPDVGELDRPAGRRWRQGPRVRPLDDGGLEVEVLEDPAEQGERGLHVEGDPHQLDERHLQPRLQRGERDDGAGGQRRRPALTRPVMMKPAAR